MDKKRRKAIPPTPDAPDEVPCKHCGEPTWHVLGPNGEKCLVLDRFQIETVTKCGVVRRESYRHEVVKRIGGYRLHEPWWFHGWDESESGWQWYASPVSLAEAEANGTIIYSQHALTCEAVSLSSIIGAATHLRLEADDEETRRKKAMGSRIAWRMAGHNDPSPHLWLPFRAKLVAPRRLKPLSLPEHSDRGRLTADWMDEHDCEQLRLF